MADHIKASFDIPFENPLGAVSITQQTMGLCEGIGTAAFQSKAIRMAIGLGFRDGVEAEQVEGLHGSIGHGRDTHSALPPHPDHLRDLSPSPIRIIPFGASASRSFVFTAGTILTLSSCSLTGVTPPSP
jgi:hypothetical protein